MTLYAIEWSGTYCGGVVLVRAKNIEDAQEKAGVTGKITQVPGRKAGKLYEYEWRE